MLYLALLSGLVNLASQSVFMRVVSAANGDYYLTYYLTTLSFIVISAFGNVVSHRIRRMLPYIEMASGLYALLIFAGIRAGYLASVALPTWAAVAMLVPPALALGVHVPLYAQYARRHIGLTYGIYHLGAAVGVISLEWFVMPHVALSLALGVLGLVQVLLGLAVRIAIRRSAPPVAAPAEVESLFAWLGNNRGAVCSVFMVSLASYVALAWGLKSYQYLVVPARMHNGLYNGAVLLMVAAGGLLALAMRKKPLVSLLALPGIWLGASVIFFHASPALLNQDNLVQLEAFALTLAVLFNMPVLVSAVVFSRAAEGLGGDRDVAAGRLMMVAAVGNLAGGVIAISSGNALLTIWPAVAAALILMVVLAAQGLTGSLVSRVGWFATSAIAGALAFSVGFQPMVTVFAVRMPRLPVVSTTLQSVLGSTAGYISLTTPNSNLPAGVKPPGVQAYFVDGHNSHFITLQDEVAVGLMPAKVIDKPFDRSVVIGLGSGQSAYGVSLISKHTDIVEISPAVVRAIPSLAVANHSILTRPGVTLHRADGLNYVRHCEPNSVDYLFNTSTYAMMFNAYKLYSDEFVRAAHTCLKPDGIFELYVDFNIASQLDQVRTFLAPVARYFKHIYFSPSPYPTILASNRDLSVDTHVDISRLVPLESDRKDLRHERQVLETISCSGWTPSGPFTPTGKEPLSTLDRPYIEETSAKLRLFDLTHHEPRPTDLFTLLRPFNPAVNVRECMSHQGWVPPPAWFKSTNPLDVRLHTGSE